MMPRNSTPNVAWKEMDSVESQASGEKECVTAAGIRHKPSLFTLPKRRQSITQFVSHTFSE